MGFSIPLSARRGFLTALYIVLVPVLGIFLKKKCGLQVWISVAVAVVGFYLLSVKEGFRLEMGDIYLVLSALMFSRAYPCPLTIFHRRWTG